MNHSSTNRTQDLTSHGGCVRLWNNHNQVAGSIGLQYKWEENSFRSFCWIACLVPFQSFPNENGNKTGELTGETVVGHIRDEERDVLEGAVDAVARLADVAARFSGHHSQDRLPAVGRERLDLDALQQGQAAI